MERSYTTTEPWTYRELDTLGVDMTRGVDLVGFEIEATDGGIGKIDEATYDVGSSYVVVDTGPWIFGKKVMLPAGTIRQIDHGEKKVFVDCTKEQIKNAPEFNPDMVGKPDYQEQLGTYYEDTYRGHMM